MTILLADEKKMPPTFMQTRPEASSDTVAGLGVSV